MSTSQNPSMSTAWTEDQAISKLKFLRLLAHWHWTLIAGTAMSAIIAVLLVLGPWIAPHDPAAQSLLKRLKPPSATYWLGTDELGRDLLSRILTGGQFAVAISALTLLLCVVIGLAVGMMSARAGGWLDELMMRIVDLILSFPDVIVAMFMVAIFGSGYVTLIVSLTVVGWAPFARLARSLTLTINTREYVAAAEVLGCRPSFILFRHVLPNIMRPVAAITFLRFGHKLITVGGLSYLGLGVQPPHADWALMMASSQNYFDRVPLLIIAPGLAIFLTALSVTWLGQGLERWHRH
ncbi:ABC transporter permease [Rhizobium multihospitium]|uniref:Peptide/nickel transport system permease protein n=1 Tax=Rhizobium multihospitium TaxID=410764 RepID=A0A1C3VY11_9HYPH|nr:ABC transporter permease [Rhizobium multihospitium]SCB32617.1 peptide/nickel transport system permease protein [Rhizobium multihospitium]